MRTATLSCLIVAAAPPPCLTLGVLGAHADTRWLTGADDHRCCLWVYAVSLAYVNVGQPGVRECLCELLLGECPGDTAGVCLHVGARCVVHVLVGDHVGDGEASARAQ